MLVIVEDFSHDELAPIFAITNKNILQSIFYVVTSSYYSWLMLLILWSLAADEWISQLYVMTGCNFYISVMFVGNAGTSPSHESTEITNSKPVIITIGDDDEEVHLDTPKPNSDTNMVETAKGLLDDLSNLPEWISVYLDELDNLY